ncbi:MAG TPA: type II toxin-antitoxin system Phd/YefM family antitoxin [Armatimonadota bacterium]|nr:type II toxin-antitoxin system Phd/YefM family antitoxin [Armatimonadota bacterium]
MATTAKAAKKSREYVVDQDGRRKAVLLPVEEYEALVQAAEDLEDIRAADEARAVGGELVPLEVVEARLRAEGKPR